MHSGWGTDCEDIERLMRGAGGYSFQLVVVLFNWRFRNEKAGAIRAIETMVLVPPIDVFPPAQRLMAYAILHREIIDGNDSSHHLTSILIDAACDDETSKKYERAFILGLFGISIPPVNSTELLLWSADNYVTIMENQFDNVPLDQFPSRAELLEKFVGETPIPDDVSHQRLPVESKFVVADDSNHGECSEKESRFQNSDMQVQTEARVKAASDTCQDAPDQLKSLRTELKAKKDAEPGLTTDVPKEVQVQVEPMVSKEKIELERKTEEMRLKESEDKLNGQCQLEEEAKAREKRMMKLKEEEDQRKEKLKAEMEAEEIKRKADDAKLKENLRLEELAKEKKLNEQRQQEEKAKAREKRMKKKKEEEDQRKEKLKAKTEAEEIKRKADDAELKENLRLEKLTKEQKRELSKIKRRQLDQEAKAEELRKTEENAQKLAEWMAEQKKGAPIDPPMPQNDPPMPENDPPMPENNPPVPENNPPIPENDPPIPENNPPVLPRRIGQRVVQPANPNQQGVNQPPPSHVQGITRLRQILANLLDLMDEYPVPTAIFAFYMFLLGLIFVSLYGA